MDRSGRRKQNSPHGGELKFGLDAEIGGVLLQLLDAFAPQFGLRLRCQEPGFPVRIGNARPPPVAVGIEFLPQQPDLARALGQQILARKPHSDREAFGAFADQHDVAGVLHDGLGDHRDILDVAYAAHRTGATRRTVHAAGIQFDHAFFVRQATETDGVVVGIVLRSLAPPEWRRRGYLPPLFRKA